MHALAGCLAVPASVAERGAAANCTAVGSLATVLRSPGSKLVHSLGTHPVCRQWAHNHVKGEHHPGPASACLPATSPGERWQPARRHVLCTRLVGQPIGCRIAIQQLLPHSQ